jgi:hypothetical protein
MVDQIEGLPFDDLGDRDGDPLPFWAPFGGETRAHGRKRRSSALRRDQARAMAVGVADVGGVLEAPHTRANKLPLGGGAVELSATGAQRAQNSGEHRIDLGQVRPYVI